MSALSHLLKKEGEGWRASWAAAEGWGSGKWQCRTSCHFMTNQKAPKTVNKLFYVNILDYVKFYVKKIPFLALKISYDT
jgi:hypothetical protein